MSFINSQNKEISFKIVYYGPGLSGKTSSVEKIFEQTKGKKETRMIKQDNGERTLFFDFIPLSLQEMQGYKLRFHLYTVPGQPLYEDSRRIILKGVDGIVFVADSQIDQMDANLESLRRLKKNLKEELGTQDRVPMVIQYNKRDSKRAANLDALKEILNPKGYPDFETIATRGEGVFDAFKTLAKQIVKSQAKSLRS